MGSEQGSVGDGGNTSSELDLARRATLDAEAKLGTALGRLRSVEDQLDAALAERHEWGMLLAETRLHLDAASAVEAELEAVKNSRSWRLVWLALSPYRWVRSRTGF